jgi:Fe-S cluster biogenesis protein NfuA
LARLHSISTPGMSAQPAHTGSPAGSVGPDAGLAEKVQRIINLIRPAVQADGGDIEFVALTPPPESVVEIRMHGACVGCPSSSVTLQTGIERNLREHIPEIRGVRAVD